MTCRVRVLCASFFLSGSYRAQPLYAYVVVKLVTSRTMAAVFEHVTLWSRDGSQSQPLTSHHDYLLNKIEHLCSTPPCLPILHHKIYFIYYSRLSLAWGLLLQVHTGGDAQAELAFVNATWLASGPGLPRVAMPTKSAAAWSAEAAAEIGLLRA